jgi:DNA-binding transcriptional regulator YhcF (GntR family)
MENPRFTETFMIDKTLPVPMYQQLINAVLTGVKDNVLKSGEILPSINQLSSHYQVSRATIEKGFIELRKMGVIGSFRGKSFFITAGDKLKGLKILLLFNNLNSYNRIIYDSLLKTLGESVCIDCYVYSNEERLLSLLTKNSDDDYTYYVMMPYFNVDAQTIDKIGNGSAKSKLVLLDKFFEEMSVGTSQDQLFSHPFLEVI